MAVFSSDSASRLAIGGDYARRRFVRPRALMMVAHFAAICLLYGSSVSHFCFLRPQCEFLIDHVGCEQGMRFDGKQ